MLRLLVVVIFCGRLIPLFADELYDVTVAYDWDTTSCTTSLFVLVSLLRTLNGITDVTIQFGTARFVSYY